MDKTIRIKAEMYTNGGDPRRATQRPFALFRPCSCGCDQRDDPKLVGYLMGIKDGKGITIRLYDEDAFLLLEALLNEHKQPNLLDTETIPAGNTKLIKCPNCGFANLRTYGTTSECDACDTLQTWVYSQPPAGGIEDAL